MKTKVIDDGGKFAPWEQSFTLNNVFQQIRLEQSLVIETFDKDIGSSDIIGATNPLTFNGLCQNEEPKTMMLDLFTPNYKNAGSIKITTQFVKREADPIPEKLNQRCYLQLTINKATFLKDADIFGNQDPYIEWQFNGQTMQTSVKDDAGKSATWDEQFKL